MVTGNSVSGYVSRCVRLVVVANIATTSAHNLRICTNANQEPSETGIICLRRTIVRHTICTRRMLSLARSELGRLMECQSRLVRSFLGVNHSLASWSHPNLGLARHTERITEMQIYFSSGRVNRIPLLRIGWIIKEQCQFDAAVAKLWEINAGWVPGVQV